MTERHVELMMPAEVVEALQVHRETVTRWAVAGKLRAVTTPGGHRRFYRADIEAILRGEKP